MHDNRAIRGKLYITNFRIYFRSDDLYQLNQHQPHFIIIDLPLGLINKIEKVGHQSSKHVNFYGIVINCKVNKILLNNNYFIKKYCDKFYEIYVLFFVYLFNL